MDSEINIAANSNEAKIIQKLKIRILPFIFLLFFVAYLDRINIGFAALTMNKELAITSRQFGLLAGIFFWGYFIFEVPSNLVLHKIGARIWVARILISWGIVAVLTGFVQTVHQLYLARFLLGLAEAGYVPGILLYLTFWFRQRELAQAIALFMTAVPVTSFVGAPLSGLILDHVHWLGISSWRWLLMLEGVPAVVCGLLTYFLLPNHPSEAMFLNEEEKYWIQRGTFKRRTAEVGKASNLGSPGVYKRKGLASHMHWLRIICRRLYDKFLDASAGKVTAGRLFQHRDRPCGHDSKSCGTVSDGFCFA